MFEKLHRFSFAEKKKVQGLPLKSPDPERDKWDSLARGRGEMQRSRFDWWELISR